MNSNCYRFPPGLLGDIASFILQQAPRPVPEIALAASLGLMSGVCGRAFNVSSTGLNLYILLLAPTGTGKEAISTGITSLMRAIRNEIPASEEFVGPASIASPQALIKYLSTSSKSFVSILGEFGLTMQQMASPRAPAYLIGLRQIMLDLYGKSGRNGELRPSIYSDREKNTAAVQSPSFSIIGEGTPETFFENMGNRFISDGLLPRFIIIEYDGKRPPLQDDRSDIPCSTLSERFATLCAQSLDLNHKQMAIDVESDPAASAEFDEFDIFCDYKINEATEEVTRHLWNRSHIRALKLASLAAVGVNSLSPIITSDLALWAILIEKTNVYNTLKRFRNGEVGDEGSEILRLQKVIEAFHNYFERSINDLKSYDVRHELHRDKVVTYTYLHRKLCGTKLFKRQNYREPTQLLKESISILIERGDIQQLPAQQMQTRYNANGAGYMLANIKLICS